MFIIGLTGGIASGKSTVSTMLQDLGAIIIDADQVVRELETKPGLVWQEIVAAFGEEILQDDGEIDRKALGEIVFGNPKALKLLNSIVHPMVKEHCAKILDKLKESGKERVVVLDVPLLIEANMTHLADEVWLVVVSKEIQLTRLMERNQLNRTEAQARLNSQMPLEDKIKFADRLIDNSGSISKTRQIVTNYWQDLLHILALREKTRGLQ